ncbi:MAG TPA: GlsB/YeaQ/YmgE family stress response membrane protein [Chloroflexota bacterium]|jgi:uncharacterized membrane protein YeaQ/YmgE (transglycosylase-associated protein family)
MTMFAWILVGLLAGLIANLIYPTPARGGWLGAMLLGMAGALVGGFVAALLTGYDWVTGVNLTTIAVSVCGALLLLTLSNSIRNVRSHA